MRDVVITTAIRTPVGRAHKGLLKDTRPDDLAGLVLAEALKRTPGLEPERIDDVLLGNAHPEGEAGYNMARIATQIAGLPDRVAGATINRFCASGLQVIVQGVHSVATGMNDVVFAGGSDCTSRVPIGGRDIAINRALARRKPGAYHSMGQTAEEVARRFGVSREEQDRFALASHRKAIAARKAGKLDGHVVPVPTRVQDAEGAWHDVVLEHDEGPRENTSLEVLAGLPTVFADDEAATVTAGNSSPLNDGAAMTVVIQLELGIPDEKLNVNGGAIAIGHPLGATGSRIAADLFAEMRRSGKEHGIISMCVGGGQGMAALFELPG
ncbi:MAG: thiolase family protein [Deinococcales bacterium]